MQRRKALALTATMLGGAIVGADVFLSRRTARETGAPSFSSDDLRLLDEVGETILPESERSPGAKAARIGEFMRSIVTDCYDRDEAAVFMAGIRELRDTSMQRYSRGFVELRPEERLDLLTDYDREARSRAEGEGEHFFTMMKQLTIWGYFTSEPGVTEALRYNPVPGRYEGCVPYEDGDRAWF
jgi:hypothetical protein